MHTIISLDRVDSTNEYARRMLRQGFVEEGVVIAAQEQYSGRGQNRNSWLSEPGKNLTFSMVLHPHFLHPSEQFRISKVFALAVRDWLETKNVRTSIKWPNDICIGSEKIAGILIEHDMEGDKLANTIAGIGININQELFPAEIPAATSLIRILNQETDLQESLDSLLIQISKRYKQLQEGEAGKIDSDYRVALTGYDIWREYRKGPEILKGKILDVDVFGRLVIEFEENLLQQFSHGEIEFL